MVEHYRRKFCSNIDMTQVCMVFHRAIAWRTWANQIGKMWYGKFDCNVVLKRVKITPLESAMVPLLLCLLVVVIVLKTLRFNIGM